MSLIRQVWLLLSVTLLLAFAGAIGVSVHSARHYLQAQLVVKNNDTAQALALTLSQQKGNAELEELAIASQFDTGYYERIRLVGADGKTIVEKQAEPHAQKAPAWFVALLGLAPADGVAQVSDGWRQVGRLEVRSQAAFADDELWQSTLNTVGVLLLLVVGAGIFSTVGVNRIRVPLLRTVDQARAITERRFVTVDEPDMPELRNVTRAMNAMVGRVKAMFDEQAGQVELLRRQAHCDPLTGLSNRAHFLSRMKVMLDAEDGAASGALVMVRLVELQSLNRTLGRSATDRLLQDAAAAMVESSRRVPGAEVGRLNGSDFALALPDVESLRDAAADMSARLRSLLRVHDGGTHAVIGAVRWTHGAGMSTLLAAADQALARAESRGPHTVELDDNADSGALGEDAWRHRIQAALAERSAQLVDFPLVGRTGELVHHESPLRLRLGEEGALVSAAQWLPMARRAQLTADVDLLAIELALVAIGADAQPRSINVSPSSLSDSAFSTRVHALVVAHPAASPKLSLELAEAGAIRQLHLVRELAEQLHGSGTKIGLEHAGERLADTRGLLEAGLDFVKLDASLLLGLSSDEARAQHVAGTVRMLHGIGLRVYAEGVSEVDDAAALWAAGVDGLTGPVVQLGRGQG
ncbi:LapD/MoxY N-terminal periplasmic domain-containing protein [Scleromatobacter humisilvae]|uniref:EAL domain-containing protein n=1 Tax=Scleromatobacter humisilvae TaxID=2897159 RepID=A0A9X1YQD5_9BURK|nr:LapD/MoxY N-terminal periplasmic domain-containing protein [Scleromatobacter humisilvae]MCK9689218.1 EAL domain-containing protein [Scleromatobacter humisilvae]